MNRLAAALLAAIALSTPAGATGICDYAIHAISLSPWAGPAPDGYATTTVGSYWSRNGYVPGSAVGRWHDGIYVVVSLPRSDQSRSAGLWVDVAYEPHWQPGKIRSLEPSALTLEIDEHQWLAGAPQKLSLASYDNADSSIIIGDFYRFAFDVDVIDAMLEASEDAVSCMHFHIAFRDVNGELVSSDDILDVGNKRCEWRCQPRLSLAGFADAYQRGAVFDD